MKNPQRFRSGWIQVFLRTLLPHLSALVSLCWLYLWQGCGGAIHTVASSGSRPTFHHLCNPSGKRPSLCQSLQEKSEICHFWGRLGHGLITRWWGQPTPSRSLGLEKGVCPRRTRVLSPKEAGTDAMLPSTGKHPHDAWP